MAPGAKLGSWVDLAISLGKLLEDGHSLAGVRANGVIGANVGAANYSLLADHEAGRQGQAEGTLAMHFV